MKMFEQAYIGKCKLSNRIIRSATFEGMADPQGFPNQSYINYYKELSNYQMGAIITGFISISHEGKAIQPGQAAMYSAEYIPQYKKVTEEVHRNNNKIFLQIAHTGRQTRSRETGEIVVGPSAKISPYFRAKPHRLTISEINRIIDKFAEAAFFAKQANFDGIQLHAAHGYLVHQFILPSINNRIDEFGIDKSLKIGIHFLNRVIDKIREKCGVDFPLLIKVSGSDDYRQKFSKQQFINLIKFLDSKNVDVIEISYGSMDQALNIFRGDVPINLVLKNNKIYKTNNKLLRGILKTFIFPIFNKKLKPFSPMYNIEYAELAKKHTQIPIISVGGFRSGKEIEQAIMERQIDFVSMCRPFLCEPDIILKIKKDTNYSSKCTNCNYCAIMCDTDFTTRCYKQENHSIPTEHSSNSN